jgi:hypothetical protein
LVAAEFIGHAERSVIAATIYYACNFMVQDRAAVYVLQQVANMVPIYFR